MSAIKVVTDSTSDLSSGLMSKFGIGIIPLTVNIGNQFFADKIDISSGEFFTKLQKEDELPTTSQPAIGKFKEKYLQLAEEYEIIISIHLSSELSGTYKTAQLAADAVMEKVDVDIRVVDSKSISLGLGFLAIYAAEAVKQGKDIEEIMDGIKLRQESVDILFTIDTLDYLQKGGRIGKAKAFLGNLFNIKPILKVDEQGGVAFHSKVRGKKRLFKKVKRLVKRKLKERTLDFPPKLALLHGAAINDLRELQSEIIDLADWDSVVVSEIGPVIGTHVGPGALGVIIL
ncbi:DegV family protein [Sporohalobacter salinus]|uniref:DegV family protein n=1 Tax=Sporohalobacter salinus TaxID=1494606 RepID=UPI0019615F9B|nr:DegV family protein [Sporohalobacter salinus]MBM7623326.1 DegV family protein with EDD domain [Sporohalobacter salinus]